MPKVGSLLISVGGSITPGGSNIISVGSIICAALAELAHRVQDAVNQIERRAG